MSWRNDRFFPRLMLWLVDSNEVKYAKKVEKALPVLHDAIGELASTVALAGATSHFLGNAESEEDRNIFRDWMNIAIRNGAIVLYSFLRVTENIDDLLYKAPSLLSKIDTIKKKSAKREFAKRFPGIEHIRNILSHPGEYWTKLGEIDRHQTTAGFSFGGASFAHNANVFVSGAWNITSNGVEFAATSKGKNTAIRYLRTLFLILKPSSAYT